MSKGDLVVAAGVVMIVGGLGVWNMSAALIFAGAAVALLGFTIVNDEMRGE